MDAVAGREESCNDLDAIAPAPREEEPPEAGPSSSGRAGEANEGRPSSFLLSADQVDAILAVGGNHTCADCARPAPGVNGAATPTWASTTYGVVLSSLAAGCHRNMGVDVSKVKSLTLDKWTDEELGRMLTIGARSRRTP